jgi:hypothetical protein
MRIVSPQPERNLMAADSTTAIAYRRRALLWRNRRRTAHNRSMCQRHATPRTPGIGEHSGLVVDWPTAIVTCQTFEERRQDEIRYQLV